MAATARVLHRPRVAHIYKRQLGRANCTGSRCTCRRRHRLTWTRPLAHVKRVDFSWERLVSVSGGSLKRGGEQERERLPSSPPAPEEDAMSAKECGTGATNISRIETIGHARDARVADMTWRHFTTNQAHKQQHNGPTTIHLEAGRQPSINNAATTSRTSTQGALSAAGNADATHASHAAHRRKNV
jgi:hypothetical protein